MRTLDERFFSKVRMTDGCWEWTAAKNGDGYGSFAHFRRSDGSYLVTGAHRVAYQEMVGAIPEGMELDHLCHNRACVRPEHLEPVDHATNARRGDGWKVHAVKTHCPQGHPYPPSERGRKRHCRICIRPLDAARQRERRARNRVSDEHLLG